MQMTKREETILSAFQFNNDAAPYIIFDVNYWLFGELKENIPFDYCSKDPSSMVNYQLKKIDRHLQKYDDVYIPFLMPWYGTGVLGSGFGIPIKFLDYMDPAVDLAVITDVAQLNDITKPNPEKDGLMPRVLNTIKYMKNNTDFPKEDLP